MTLGSTIKRDSGARGSGIGHLNMRTHGHHAGTPSPTYRCWSNMLSRCRNPNVPKFASYGGRGIKVCHRWLRFENFLADMGVKPSGMTLGRINNDGNYCKSNCRWETHLQQGSNTRQNRWLSFGGKTKTLSQWSRETGINITTIYMRVFHYGWTVEDALTNTVQLRKETH